MTRDRCSGHCCRSFWLPYTPRVLRDNFRTWKAGKRDFKVRDERSGKVEEIGLIHDIEIIYPMVRHLGKHDYNPQLMHAKRGSENNPGHYYRCVHKEVNGNCGIYADRPAMCRDYPYGRKCYYVGCTWRKVRCEAENKRRRRTQ